MTRYDPEVFSQGDRVTSTIGLYYEGVPGTILRVAQICVTGYFTRYVVELDNGKIITLESRYLKHIEE